MNNRHSVCLTRSFFYPGLFVKLFSSVEITIKTVLLGFVLQPFTLVLSIRIPSLCLLPVEKGRCRASIERYYYNSTYGFCEIFDYGGCGGNENNFQTEQDCLRTCARAPKCTKVVAIMVIIPTVVYILRSAWD